MENYATKFINQIVRVRVDRVLGSKHPKHNIYYSLNYGYIEHEFAPDGEEVDAYILGVFEPKAEFTGRCIAVIHRLDDNDDKLVVAPDGAVYSDEQILSLVEFQERFFKSVIIRSI